MFLYNVSLANCQTYFAIVSLGHFGSALKISKTNVLVKFGYFFCNLSISGAKFTESTANTACSKRWVFRSIFILETSGTLSPLLQENKTVAIRIKRKYFIFL